LAIGLRKEPPKSETHQIAASAPVAARTLRKKTDVFGSFNLDSSGGFSATSSGLACLDTDSLCLITQLN
jgi:hypothetical protein